MLNCHLLEIDSIRVGIEELLGGDHVGELRMLQDPRQELLELLLSLYDELSV